MNRLLPLVLVLAFACRKDKDFDGDGVTDGDCAPYDAESSPDAAEVCDGRDNNCDGAVDEGVADAPTWYADGDSDGFGDDATGAVSCFPSEGTVPVGGDCDDADAVRHPGAAEACTADADLDCDGANGLVDGDGDGSAACLDCDDDDKDVHPGADESCNEADDDCDGVIDEGATDAPTWFVDLDGDGAGSDRVTFAACEAPTGFVSEDDDCDDLNVDAHPGGAETCDGADNDCNGTIDDGAKGVLDWYQDSDGDGFGDPTADAQACVRPSGYSANGDDCNDADALTNPSVTETCTDTVDRNCDGSVGQADGDGDGTVACEDCDDTRDDVHPGAVETCDDADNDCNGQIDESAPTWYLDADGDLHGNAKISLATCVAPVGYVAVSDDCDDLAAATYPTATEVCDGRDNDCASGVPAGEADADNDGFRGCAGDCDDSAATAHPGGVEVCNDVDDDCDGTKDDASVDAPRWYTDTDTDGFGTGAGSTACVQPVATATVGGDCDDASNAVSPTTVESCNTKDDDCDGQVDETGATGSATYYLDADGDGVGGSKISVSACAAPAGYVSTATDCDDLSAATYPLATELCDGRDNDCASGVPANESDADKDGYRGCAGDCDDGAAAIHVGAIELCNTKDDNCDGNKDEAPVADGTRWYTDSDKDGYGTGVGTVACAAPVGTVASPSDCNDALATTNPGAAETCNTIDDNCNGTKDENPVDGQTWYLDADADKHGTPTNYTLACAQPAGRVSVGDDCNDGDAKVYTGALEVWYDGIDEDCNGGDDYDQDGDGEKALLAGKGADCEDTNPLVTKCLGGSSALAGRDCDAVHQSSVSQPSGLYWIDPDGAGASAPYQAYCDMVTQGGGWTLVASVVTHSATFWTPGTYTLGSGARNSTIGTASPLNDYVLALPQWRQLLANKGAGSMLRLTVRRIDNSQDVTLGFLRGLQMNASGGWSSNPNTAYKGDFVTTVPATGACVIQYNSDISVGLSQSYFNSPDSACTGYLGWNGFCGYPSLGHAGSYASSGATRFSHACSLDLNYYCSADNMTGSGGQYCYFERKWYWIR